MMVDIALALDVLVPGADWQGSAMAGTKAAFGRLRWHDARPKPSWAAVKAKADELAALPPPDDGDRAERAVDASPALRGLIRVLGRRFNLTEREIRDAIKAEVAP
jgi:hypothetical protein